MPYAYMVDQLSLSGHPQCKKMDNGNGDGTSKCKPVQPVFIISYAY